MQIKNKVAVVTGAASGIGKATAFELVNRGIKAIGIVDISENANEFAAQINEMDSSTVAIPFVGDVTDEGFRKQVFTRMAETNDVVNILVPAAGITRDRYAVKVNRDSGKADMYPMETFQLVLNVNLLHPIYWAMELVAQMAEYRHRRGQKKWGPAEEVQGTVIFIGSVASQGNKGQISYSTTKAGLEGAASTLMKEAIFHGVRTGVIHPGLVDTPIRHNMPEGYVEKYILPDTQLGRLIRLD